MDETGPGAFGSTVWSVVLSAGDASSPDRRRALETLCRTYWKPIYAFLRRRGLDPDEARDATQDFFAYLLEKDLIERAGPDAGRFRSFLLAVLRRYMANRFRRDRAARRGGDVRVLRLAPHDTEDAESEIGLDPADTATPENAFWRSWALSVLRAAVERVRADYAARGQEDRFDLVRAHLGAAAGRASYDDLAESLGTSVADITNLLHRTRRRLARAMRDVLLETVESESMVEDELRHVLDALGG